jgi:penicillin-binding protein 1C
VIVRSILSDNVARAPTFGFNSALFTSVETAVKTGTSKDMRDNWCIGFSDRYTVGVWVGNFSGDSMWNLTGVAGAAPIWSDVMHALHQNKSSRFSMPEGIRLHSVDVRFAFKNGVIQELFIDGTEPSDSLIEDIKKSYGVRISYPTDESLMAIDPDIPQKNQKIVFSANAFSTALAWQLDGVIIGPAHEEFSWAPVKGRHELAIIDKGSGNQVDRVRFVVR